MYAYVLILYVYVLMPYFYVLMRHDYHVCYIIADLTMRSVVWGATPSSLFRVYGNPTSLSLKEVAQGRLVYKGGCSPGY